MSSITDIIHAVPIDELTGSISVPVYQTSTFVQEAPGVNKGYDYARTGNPTRKALENLVAKLEGGRSAFAFATGLAAIDAVAKLLSQGDEIIAVDDIYGGAYRLFTHVYEKLGIKIHYVDTTDAENILEHVNGKTRMIWIESPTNPTLKISDIQTISKIAGSINAYLVVDSTFASPVSQTPLKIGADIVIHSGTKYLGGHSDLLAGLVVTKTEELSEKIKFIQNASGGVLGPWDCFLTIRGIETLGLRVIRQCETALKLAHFLEKHEAVDKVHYPGLRTHKNHPIAAVQQNGLFGGVISFSLKNDTPESAELFVNNTKYFKLAESLGGVKSLLCQPSKMTHASIPRENRLLSGIQDSLIRLSCGIEDAEDLIADVKNALERVSSKKEEEAHHENVNIGLFGFGVVGEGIYQVLTQKPQLGAVIRRIAIKHPDKKRDAPLSLFTTDANEILQDHTIDLVVELIDDSEAALPIVLEAMNNGKSVISANKKMISDHLLLLIETAEKNKVSFLYEASVCGSVPVIRNLEEYFDNDLITSVTGIVNGSTNFILTQMAKHDLSYDVALQKAQELGFAESNPGLDVEGWDARNKLKIISLHAFGKLVDDRNIPVKGINSITKFDINYAKEKGLVIKLIATCKVDEEGTIEEVSVLPTFLPKFHPLRLTDNEFNGILIGGQLSDEQLLYGKGAGRYPTSSAVLSDISAYRYNYKYEYKKSIGIVEAIDPVQCKFYIGFNQGADVNLSSLGEVEETYETEDQCYATLYAYPEKVMPLCSSSKISVIRYL